MNNNNSDFFGYSKGYTHAGIFHADEVFTTAFILMNAEGFGERF